jgi:hypothetical protein
VRDYAFYSAGFADLKGWRRGIVPFRRLLRRILRPMLYRQAELLAQLGAEIEQLRAEGEHIRGRLDQVEASLRAIHGLSCDVLATRRRLAAIEDHLIASGRSEPLANRVHGPHLTGVHSPQTR